MYILVIFSMTKCCLTMFTLEVPDKISVNYPLSLVSEQSNLHNPITSCIQLKDSSLSWLVHLPGHEFPCPHQPVWSGHLFTPPRFIDP